MFDEYDLNELVDYIDWTPFFMSWDISGKYPAIFDDPKRGEAARNLFDDAQKILHRMIDEKRVSARGVIGFWPASRRGDDIVVYTDETLTEKELTTLHHLRQQDEKAPGKPMMTLSDFVAPEGDGPVDYVGGFAVTTGIGAEEFSLEFKDRQRRLQRHHGQGPGGPSGGSLCRAHARAGPQGVLGLCQRRGTGQ